MASRAAIATMNDLAFKRLYRAMSDISEAFPDVEPAVLPTYRDIRYQEAARYDALASWAERLAVAMGVSSIPVEVEKPDPEIVEDEMDEDIDASTAPTEKVVTQDVEMAEDEQSFDTSSDDSSSDYSTLSNTKLRKLAKERGIALHDRGEIIDALEAADGLTEDEQAAKHAELDTETPDEAAS